MEGVHIIKRPKLRNPHLIVAWPGMGEVAFKAAQFLIKHLKAVEFAYIKSKDFFYLTGSSVQDGILSLPNLPYSRFYYWKDPYQKNDLIIFLSNAQPDLAYYEQYCQRIMSVVDLFSVKTVICFAAMPLPIEHTQTPGVWAVATDNKLKDMLLKYNLKIMPEGQISGMNGLFLGVAKKHKLDGFCLLGEIPVYTIQAENPKASAVLLETLSKIIKIPIDVKDLKEQADIVEGQINQLVDYLKTGPQQPGPIGEEEIEKISRSLSQYTKLPDSIKKKIEVLFEQAKKDISKVSELKKILDQWHAYKEYEDKFLDLFKKPKDKSN